MKKRGVAVLLCTVLAAAMLSACGGKDTDDKPNPNKNVEDAQDKDADADDEEQNKAEVGKGGEYLQYDETAFMLNGKEIKFPYYGVDNLCEETGLVPYYGFGAEELKNDFYESAKNVKLRAVEGVEDEDVPSVKLFVRNLEEKEKIPTKDGYITSISVEAPVDGVNISIRGISLGSTEEEMLAAFSEFGPDEDELYIVENEDGRKEYFFYMYVPNTYHEVCWNFDIIDGKVCYMSLGDGATVHYTRLDEVEQ